MQRAREMEEGVEPPPGYRPNYPTGIQVHPNGITVDSLAALFQAHAGIQAAALTALSQIDFTLIPNIERPAHTQVSLFLLNSVGFDFLIISSGLKSASNLREKPRT